ncbi:MAG: ABC transporter ATP-binding protein [Fervidobacterium sp.]
MIKIDNLSFFFEETKIFFENLNLLIRDGIITSIIGPNGSGKSTLLNLLARILSPRCGSILIDKMDISRLSRKDIAKKLSIIFQQNYAPEDLTVRELLSFGRNPHKKYFDNLVIEDVKLIEWAMKVTRITHLSERRLSQLSGGEKQRVWLAVGLVQNTRYLLLDEPTTYLDIRYQIEFLNLIRKINKEFGLTVIMVLHDINQAIKYSDSIIVINQGKIVACGEPSKVITQELLINVFGIRSKLIEDNGEYYFVFQETV